MPAWARSITCRLYPHPVDEAVTSSSSSSYNGDTSTICSWMCREQVQHYDNFTKRVAAHIDTTCSGIVICAINVRGFLKDNAHCERIRLDVEVDKDPAESYIYNAQDLRAAGHELLTDDLRTTHRMGQIKVHFEAWGRDRVCDPRRVTFVLHYYKDDEALHPKERLVKSTRPPLLGYEFRQNRQKYKTLNGSPSRRGSHDTKTWIAPDLEKREDGKEEGEIVEEAQIEEVAKEDPIKRSYRRRQERLADRARSEAEDSIRHRRRQRSVSRERRDDHWSRDKGSFATSSRHRDDLRPSQSLRRELSPIRTHRPIDRQTSRECSAPKSAIDSIKQANEQLALEIEQLQLLKAQKQLKKELEKLKQEINQPEETSAPHRLPRSSSLSIDCRRPSTSDAESSQRYEPLSPASFLDDVSRSCHSGQVDGQFVLSSGVAPISIPTAGESIARMSAPLQQQPRDSFAAVSPSHHEISISEADLNNLRNIRQQLYSSRLKPSSL